MKIQERKGRRECPQLAVAWWWQERLSLCLLWSSLRWQKLETWFYKLSLSFFIEMQAFSSRRNSLPHFKRVRAEAFSRGKWMVTNMNISSFAPQVPGDQQMQITLELMLQGRKLRENSRNSNHCAMRFEAAGCLDRHWGGPIRHSEPQADLRRCWLGTA